ncbi:MAG: CDP-diacylglycerol--glycerol-3-phosphate 3-phosphatidyltransferase [Xanthomonadales bacterium]|nr:CDP-diacylglycerol--glycerol-3-phosphate 3-phosphatidyltransferase [Xanthomonadales bacterium]
MELNTANVLTLLRILLIPVLVVVFYLPNWWSNWATAIIFSVAAITDWLDGYVARRFNQTSRFGAFLDPVADKLMVGVTLVLLVQHHPTAFFAIPAAVIIGREITISALREWMAELGQRSAVNVKAIGKVKTTFQMIALILLLLREPVLFIPTFEIGHVALWVAALLTIWSMIIYLRAAWPLLTHPMQKPPE